MSAEPGLPFPSRRRARRGRGRQSSLCGSTPYRSSPALERLGRGNQGRRGGGAWAPIKLYLERSFPRFVTGASVVVLGGASERFGFLFGLASTGAAGSLCFRSWGREGGRAGVLGIRGLYFSCRALASHVCNLSLWCHIKVSLPDKELRGVRPGGPVSTVTKSAAQQHFALLPSSCKAPRLVAARLLSHQKELLSF